MAETLLTIEGLKELEAELDQLKVEGRKEAAEKINLAKSFGDLSENSEYDEAMNDQAKLEARISEIEYIIKNAKILDVESLGNENIHIGSTVKLTDKKKKSYTYTIVGFAQADPAAGKISDESPVGKALIGHKKGDKVTIDVPNGTLEFKIVDITR